jgi:hypothetical protein
MKRKDFVFVNGLVILNLSRKKVLSISQIYEGSDDHHDYVIRLIGDDLSYDVRHKDLEALKKERQDFVNWALGEKENKPLCFIRRLVSKFWKSVKGFISKIKVR